jgi:hypothetical protein
MLLVVFLADRARDDAAAVRAGGVVTSPFVPWRALPARVRMRESNAAAVRLSTAGATGCPLRFFGVGDEFVQLYDTRLGKLFRVPARQTAVSTAASVADC